MNNKIIVETNWIVQPNVIQDIKFVKGKTDSLVRLKISMDPIKQIDLLEGPTYSSIVSETVSICLVIYLLFNWAASLNLENFML
jgi:hypothetical protein